MTDPKHMRALLRAIEQFRTSISPTVPTSLVQAFIVVGMNEGQTLTEITDRLSTNMSTASRHMLDLGDLNRKKEPGYGLVLTTMDPMNLREKHYSLSPKGKLLWRSLEQIMEA